MPNPKCTFCPKESSYFPVFGVFAPGIAYAKICDMTFDAPFCDECREKTKDSVKAVLTDDMWRQIQAQVRRDAKHHKVPVPPLDRSRTMLNFRPFVRNTPATIIDIKGEALTTKPEIPRPPALPPGTVPQPKHLKDN